MKLGIEKHMPEVMAILYRPVVDKEDKVYTIEPYDGEIKIRTEQMRKMSAIQVQSALVFFYHLGSQFIVTSQSFLKERQMEQKKQSPQSPSLTNGLGLV